MCKECMKSRLGKKKNKRELEGEIPERKERKDERAVGGEEEDERKTQRGAAVWS